MYLIVGSLAVGCTRLNRMPIRLATLLIGTLTSLMSTPLSSYLNGWLKVFVIVLSCSLLIFSFLILLIP